MLEVLPARYVGNNSMSEKDAENGAKRNLLLFERDEYCLKEKIEEYDNS